MLAEFALLGLVQGLTEFLPVSSSGHLVLAQEILGWSPPGLVLEAVVHLATLVAVILYFRKEVSQLALALTRGGSQERRYVALIALGTLPVVVVGLTVRAAVERAFASPGLTGGMLLVTASALMLADRRARQATDTSPTPGHALSMGLAQAVALLPGISRSGVTISAGINTGLRPIPAARFSFLLSIPALLGAGLWELATATTRGSLTNTEIWGLAFAGVVAMLSGLVAIRLLLIAVRRRRLRWFALYCALAGSAAVAFSLF